MRTPHSDTTHMAHVSLLSNFEASFKINIFEASFERVRCFGTQKLARRPENRPDGLPSNDPQDVMKDKTEIDYIS